MSSIKIFGKKFNDEGRKLRKSIRNFWYDRKFCDLNLRTSDGFIFPVHKLLICSLCGYFKDLVLDESEAVTNELQLNIDSSILENILKFIYSGTFSLEELKFETTIKLYKTASIYRMTSLTEIIEEHLLNTLSLGNALSLWRAAVEHFNVDFRKLVEKFIETNTIAFLDIYLLQLSASEFLTISRLKELNCSPEELYLFALKWLKSDFKNRKQYIKYMFQNIKFGELPLKIIMNKTPLDGTSRSENKLLHDLIVKELNNVPTTSSSNPYRHIGDTDERYKKNVFYFKNRNKTRLLITDNDFNLFDIESKTITKLFDSKRDKWFSCTLFYGNKIFFNGGFNTNKCEYFDNDKFYELPPIKQSKWKHSTIHYNNKIYSCGGQNKNTMEIFDLNSMKWVDGPSMNFSRWSFGLVEKDGVLYVIGGNVYDISCKSWYSYCYLEQYDPRTNFWQILNGPKDITPGATKAINFNNDIFGFKWNQVHQYAVKPNEIECSRSVFYPIGLESTHFEIFKCNETLCVLGENEKKTVNYFEFDPRTTQFHNFKVINDSFGNEVHII